ncbi:ATP-binding cassette domain-containing protein [Haladaptatus sp. F3-133]|jgi:biotin transport system ATP-binding protein|uniref:ATP-binding cassette domain-containing protein n=1 Tax=Halorutilus salinus TaxID=2487751 RepID=A0A9Q4C2L8_9EURY|nr:ATP-binding cassette domain-containing protein [Halorutilus salinus]MCX2817952.1 ATP-binding cassette domain-containing protein [Halorutilus salinus]
MIRFEGVAHERDGERALDGVSLEIDSGGFVLLLGRNGSGKTTLLRHMNALLTPDEGSVLVDGVPTDEDGEGARRKVGMVFQDAGSQIVAETVKDDVAFGPENLGLETDEIRERVDEAVSAVGATALLDRSPYELSGGELRRVALAGVLAMRPDVLALDEPLADLDYEGEKAVVERVVGANQDGKTVVVATHDAEPFVDLAERAVVLEDGSVAEDGTPDELFSRGLEGYGVRTPCSYR